MVNSYIIVLEPGHLARGFVLNVTSPRCQKQLGSQIW